MLEHSGRAFWRRCALSSRDLSRGEGDGRSYSKQRNLSAKAKQVKQDMCGILGGESQRQWAWQEMRSQWWTGLRRILEGLAATLPMGITVIFGCRGGASSQSRAAWAAQNRLFNLAHGHTQLSPSFGPKGSLYLVVLSEGLK